MLAWCINILIKHTIYFKSLQNLYELSNVLPYFTLHFKKIVLPSSSGVIFKI